MKTFNYFVTEAKIKKATFTFGRFNPPTTGHELLVNKLRKLGAGSDVLLFSSHSNDKNKNPLSHRDKVKFLKAFFGKKLQVIDSTVRTVFEIAVLLHDKGYKEIRMVVGSDRVKEFENLLTKYNNVKARHGFYNFSKIDVISAGERDPDADDVTGMSASKMREFAEKGDFESFKDGVPSTGKRFAQQLYKAIRRGMGINEGLIPNYIMEDILKEGVYDQGVFKAVFLMGGPGSGKSTIVKRLALPALGLKMVNSDRHFENGLKKAGLGLDLRTLDPADYDPIRKKAKTLVGKELDMYIQGRLGLIFDTTSANLQKIKTYKKHLDNLGYEYKIIFVNTNLENAQKRNELRARKLAPEIVKSDWESVQKNMKTLQSLFKRDFIEVTNNDDVASFEQKAERLYGRLLTWSGSFPSNKKALAWKQAQLDAKRS